MLHGHDILVSTPSFPAFPELVKLCQCTAAKPSTDWTLALMATDIVRIGRALLSVSDKTGLLDLARGSKPSTSTSCRRAALRRR